MRGVLTEQAVQVASIQKDGEVGALRGRAAAEPGGAAIRRKGIEICVGQAGLGGNDRPEGSPEVFPQTAIAFFAGAQPAGIRAKRAGGAAGTVRRIGGQPGSASNGRMGGAGAIRIGCAPEAVRAGSDRLGRGSFSAVSACHVLEIIIFPTADRCQRCRDLRCVLALDRNI